MGKVKQLIYSFKQSKGSDIIPFVDEVIDKILYDNGNIESDLTALIIKAADLRKQGATYHSLVKDKREYSQKMSLLISELSVLNSFLEFVAEKIPGRLNEIKDSIRNNGSYIHLHH